MDTLQDETVTDIYDAAIPPAVNNNLPLQQLCHYDVITGWRW